MKNRTAATVILMIAMFMDLTDSTIANVALPAIGTDLGATPNQLEWIIAGYVVAFATLLITGARLGDIFGRRTVFIIGVAGFTLTSLLAAVAISADSLVAMRILQGGFAGIMVPQVLSSVQVMYRPEERGPILGITGALSAAGAVTGLLAGGALVTADLFGLGWRTIFLVNVPLGVALIVLALVLVPESRSPRRARLDLLGLALGALTVFLLVFPLIEGRHTGWAWWIIALLAAAPVVGAVFVLHERRRRLEGAETLLPVPLFRDRGFRPGLIVQVLSAIGNGGYALVLLYHLQEVLGFSAFAAGATILPLALGSVVGAGIAAPLAPRLGRTLVAIGGVVQALAFLAVAVIINAAGTHLSGWDLALPLGISGIGMMMLIMPMMGLALATVPATEAGAASGTLSTFGQLGMALGVAIAGTLYFGLAESASAETGVQVALGVPIIAYALSAAAGLLLPRTISGREHSVKDPLTGVGIP